MPCNKINSKLINNLNLHPEIIKLLKNIRNTVQNVGIGKATKSTERKPK